MHRVALRRGSNPRRPRGGTGLAPTYPFTITSLTPSSVAQGSPNTQIAAGGVDFQSGSTVYVDGVAATTAFVSAVLINFTLTAAVALVPGYKVIQIKRTTFASNLRLLAVLFPLPTLATATITGAGNTLNVTGTGWFPVGTHARIDDTIDAPFTWLSSTTGTVTIPQAVLDVPGTHTLRIFNDAPGGGLTAPRNFETKFKNSTLVSLSMTEQYAGREAGPILLEGALSPESIFYPESILKVDTTPVAFTLIDGNHLSFTIPGSLLMTPGPHSVTVTNPTSGGGGGVSNALTFNAFAPTVVSLSITEVVQFFDGFDVTGSVDMTDTSFVVTYNNVAQPTTWLDSQHFVAHVTTAANSVPGTTMVRVRDGISGVSSLNAIAITVFAWTPADVVDPAVRWWLDGSSLVDDGTGRASAWNDKSAGARHISQANAAKRPLIVTNALNGQTAARFDNVRGDRFETGVTWLISGTAGLITKTAFNIWVVARTTLIGTGQRVLADGPGYLGVANTTTTPERLGALIDGGGTVIPYVAFTWSTQVQWSFRHRQVGAAAYARVNRSDESTLSVPNINLFNPTNVLVSNGTFKGDIFFVFVAGAELNMTYKALLDNMLSYTYQLPFGTPGQAPSITSVTPNVCTRLDLPFYFVVEDTGGSYTATSVVNIGRYPQPTEFLSATQLRARMTTDGVAFAGGRAITVADAGGISGPTGITVFERPDQPGPNLYATTPNTAYQHGAPLPIDCTGVGFTASSVVRANGVACPTVFDTATHITATLPVTALDVLPGPLITVTDGAFTSNPLEITLTPWSPKSIVALTAWFRADDVTLGAGLDVAQWNDKSGFGRHLTQATVSKRPLLVASHANFNGKPVLDFDGVDDYLSGASLSTHYTTTCAIAGAVFRARAITGSSPITAPYANNCVVASGGGFFGFSLRNTPIAYCYMYTGSAYNVATCAVAANTTYCAVATAIGGSTINLSLNGVNGTPAAIPLITTGAPVFALASSNAFAAGFLNGLIAEVFTTNLPLPAQDAICWPNYCRFHYGTP